MSESENPGSRANGDGKTANESEEPDSRTGYTTPERSTFRGADGRGRTRPRSDSTTRPVERAESALASIRHDNTRRRIALVVAAAIGLVVASVHWLGLVLAGALVGLTRRTLRGAVATGFLFGIVVLVASAVWISPGSPANVLALAPLTYVAVGIGLGAPTWGALARGIL